MDRGYVPKSQVNCIPPRTTWKSDSPSRLKENYGRQSRPPSAFQFLKRTLRCHEASKPFRAGSTDRLDGTRAGCHEKYFIPAAGRRRDIFIDSPFQRTLSDYLGVTKPSEWDRVRLADNTELLLRIWPCECNRDLTPICPRAAALHCHPPGKKP